MPVTTEEELAKAIDNNTDTIEIEGSLKTKVIRIKATGKVSWLVALGAIGIAVTILVSTGGAGVPVSGFVGAGAVSILGLPAALSAVSIAIASGSVGALNTLRRYSIVENSDKTLVLKRK